MLPDQMDLGLKLVRSKQLSSQRSARRRLRMRKRVCRWVRKQLARYRCTRYSGGKTRIRMQWPRRKLSWK